MKRLVLLCTIVALALTVPASAGLARGDRTPAAPALGDARVRVAHASPDAPAVDVLVDGGVAFSNLAFKDISEYALLPAGAHLVQVVPTGAAEPVVISATLTLDADQDYTVAATDLLANITPIVLEDDNSAPAACKAHVRFVHLSPDAPSVDVAVTGGPVLFGNVAFQQASGYLPVDAGTYDLEVRLAGTDTVVLPVPGVTLNDGTVYTVFAMGLAAGTPPLEAVPSADSGNARVRVVHASPDAPAVDVLVDGGVAFSNLAFKDISKYAALPNGTYLVQVVPTGAVEPVVISATLTLDPDQDYTVAATDLLANITPLVLEDDNSAPAVGKAHVRFVHLSPDAPAVDVAVTGGPVLFGNIAFQEASGYLPVDAGTYDLEVRLAGTDTVVLPVPGVTLSDGVVYTAFAMGLAAGTPPLEAVLSADNTGSIAIVKDAPEADETHAFGFTGDLGDFALTSGESKEFPDQVPGTYTVAEDPASFPDKYWTLVSVTCVDQMNPRACVKVNLPTVSAAIRLQPGQHLECTFLNERGELEPDSENARVRVAHASPDAPAVDVLVDGGVAFSNLAFKDISEYALLPAGAHLVQVVPTGAAEPVVISATLTLDPDQDYTVAATDLLANITPIVLEDDNSAPAVGKAHVRFVHLSPDAPPVDVAVADGSVLFGNVAFQEASSYLPVDAGTYDLEVRLAGTDNVVLSVPGVTLNDGTVYTVFAMGLAAGTPPLEAVPSADSGNARVRVVHASPDAPAVDVLVDGVVVFSNLAFGDITAYATLRSGIHRIQVVPTGTAAPVVSSVTVTLDRDTDYTVAAAGTLTPLDAADFELLPLVDNNAPPALGKAHVRFVHLSPDAQAVDIAVKDGLNLFSNIEFKEVGGYLPVEAGTYDLEVRPAGKMTAVLTPTVALDANSIYTIFAVGLAAGTPGLEALPSLDQSYARVRVVHAVSDAPPVDVRVNGTEAFSNVTYEQITGYAAVLPGTYTVGLAPTGTVTPVLTTTLALTGGMDFTVAAAGTLTDTDSYDFELLALMDDNSLPAQGKAHVRFVHLSPDAPAVDVAVKDGPALFSDIEYKEIGDYLPVDAGTYDLEVRPAGDTIVVLALDDTRLDGRVVYTVFAVGRLTGPGSVLTPLKALFSVDRALYEMFLPIVCRNFGA